MYERDDRYGSSWGKSPHHLWIFKIEKSNYQFPKCNGGLRIRVTFTSKRNKSQEKEKMFIGPKQA